MSTDLRTYKAMVQAAMRRARDSHKPEVFENSGPDHARIVIEVMLENAAESVDIICGQMHSGVWSARAIAEFLERRPKGRVRIILDDMSSVTSETSEVEDMILHDKVEVRVFPQRLSQHLCVVDRSHVRIENDRFTRVASIKFGDSDNIGKRAGQIFDDIWAASVSAEGLLPA